MSNAPFKIAFWMMSLAFGLTILMVGLKPEEIRFALNPSKRPQMDSEKEFYEDELEHLGEQNIVNEDVFVDAVDTILVETSAIEESQPRHLSEPMLQPSSIRRNHVSVAKNSPKQIRVASADVNAPLGIGSPEIEETTILVPVPDARFASSNSDSMLALKNPVPDPVDISTNRYQLSMTDEIAELKGNVLRLKLAQARQEFEELRRSQVKEEFEYVQIELDQLKEQIHEFKQVHSVIAEKVTVIPEAQKYERSVSEIALVSEVDDEAEINSDEVNEEFESVLEVTPNENKNSFDFRFEHAPISDVLKTLGKYGGRKVVLSSEISGTFSGEFKESSPNQAFAAVIKANQFGLSFRGDYVLVRAESDPKIR